ncbi:MAG: carboxypeptidase-like regulatory domain-containing protein, partial [Bacteroidales bacterium]|nr:carboxypeptidase-like regulatory domain-containing protein [Bacteroidales bacterium]
MPNLTISGKVVDKKNDKNIKKVRIEVWGNKGEHKKPISKSTTDDQGNFKVILNEIDIKKYLGRREPEFYVKVFDGKKLLSNTKDTTVWKPGSRKKVIDIGIPDRGGPRRLVTVIVTGTVIDKSNQPFPAGALVTLIKKPNQVINKRPVDTDKNGGFNIKFPVIKQLQQFDRDDFTFVIEYKNKKLKSSFELDGWNPRSQTATVTVKANIKLQPDIPVPEEHLIMVMGNVIDKNGDALIGAGITLIRKSSHQKPGIVLNPEPAISGEGGKFKLTFTVSTKPQGFNPDDYSFDVMYKGKSVQSSFVLGHWYNNKYIAEVTVKANIALHPQLQPTEIDASALSLNAYLADLLDYTLKNLEYRYTGGGQFNPLTLDELQKHFPQPFENIIENTDKAGTLVSQSRLCIEILLKNHEQQSDTYIAFLKEYVQRLYRRLLLEHGISQDDIRGAKSSEELLQLSDRIGISPDNIKDLQLSFDGNLHPSNYLKRIEKIYGLANPYESINPGYVASVPDLLTWRREYLREKWLREDRSSSTFGANRPIIDPDIIDDSCLKPQDISDDISKAVHGLLNERRQLLHEEILPELRDLRQEKEELA